MIQMHRARRVISRAVLVAAVCIVGLFALSGTANADPYPPVPPTALVPAALPAPAPAVTNPATGAQIIAPESYPVQARTGAGPATDSSPQMLIGVSLGAGALVLLVAMCVVRRIRRVR